MRAPSEISLSYLRELPQGSLGAPSGLLRGSIRATSGLLFDPLGLPLGFLWAIFRLPYGYLGASLRLFLGSLRATLGLPQAAELQKVREPGNIVPRKKIGLAESFPIFIICVKNHKCFHRFHQFY